MESSIFLVYSNAAPGKLKEYNEWYDKEHLPDVVQVPGVLSAQRFKFTGASVDRRQPAPHDYLAVYELDGSPRQVLTSLGRLRKEGEMPIPDSIVDIRGWVYEPITPVVFEGEHGGRPDG